MSWQSYVKYGGTRPPDGKRPKGYKIKINGVWFKDPIQGRIWATLRNDLRNGQREGFPRTPEGVAAYRRHAREGREDRAFSAYERAVTKMARDYVRKKYGLAPTSMIPKRHEAEYRRKLRDVMAYKPFTGPKPGR